MSTRRNWLPVVTLFVVSWVACSAWAADAATDQDISKWVKDALRQDPRTIDAEITVSTAKGIVTLSGTVPNVASQKYADQEAKKIEDARVKGVQGVVNKLVVDGDTGQSDTVLEQMVRNRLMQNAITSPAVFGLQVKVNNGIATLTGRVDVWAQRAEAERVTLGTEGIWRVDNRSNGSISLSLVSVRRQPSALSVPHRLRSQQLSKRSPLAGGIPRC